MFLFLAIWQRYIARNFLSYGCSVASLLTCLLSFFQQRVYVLASVLFFLKLFSCKYIFYYVRGAVFFHSHHILSRVYFKSVCQ